MTISEFSVIASLVLNVVIALVMMTWGIGRVRDAIKTEIQTHREKFEADIHALRLSTGEIASALRQKIVEVELYVRDTFMRRDSFHENMRVIGDDIRTQFSKIDQRLERMETKIDTNVASLASTLLP